jgi:hypothetical protein
MMAIVVASVAFLPPILWSQWGPALVGRALSTRLHTSVTVQRVTGGGWRSVEIQHLTMAESAAPHALPLLQFERLTIDRGLLPLLFSTKPVALRIDSVDLQLRQQQDVRTPLARGAPHAWDAERGATGLGEGRDPKACLWRLGRRAWGGLSAFGGCSSWFFWLCMGLLVFHDVSGCLWSFWLFMVLSVLVLSGVSWGLSSLRACGA